MDATTAVRQLGGDVRAREAENVEALVTEILILRQKAADADHAETRAERRIGKEIEARQRAERRAAAAEEALGGIEAAISRARRKAISGGAPLRLPEEEHPALVMSGIARVGEGEEYPRVETG